MPREGELNIPPLLPDVPIMLLPLEGELPDLMLGVNGLPTPLLRKDVLTLAALPTEVLMLLPLLMAGVTILLPLPIKAGLAALPAGSAGVRDRVGLIRSRLGTLVEVNALALEMPLPPRFLPLNLATGSIRVIRWFLTSVKWLEMNRRRK